MENWEGGEGLVGMAESLEAALERIGMSSYLDMLRQKNVTSVAGETRRREARALIDVFSFGFSRSSFRFSSLFLAVFPVSIFSCFTLANSRRVSRADSGAGPAAGMGREGFSREKNAPCVRRVREHVWTCHKGSNACCDTECVRCASKNCS